MKHIIAYLSYALFSITAGLIIAAELQGTSVFIGFLYAQILFLSCIIAHEIINSRFWQKTTKWQLKALAHRQTRMEEEFKSLRNQTKAILDILTTRKTSGGPVYVKQQAAHKKDNVIPLHDREKEPAFADGTHDWYELQKENAQYDSGEWFEPSQSRATKKKSSSITPYKPALIKKDEHQRTQVAFDYDNIISQSQALRFAQDITLKEIRTSLRNKDIHTSLQPVVNLKSMGAVHYECFTSILSADKEPIPPKNYIEKAKEAGLLPNIDAIVLTQSLESILADAKKIPSNWRHIFFNVSLETFKTEDVFLRIENFFKIHANLNKRIVFEISYEDFLRNVQFSQTYLKRLQKFGAHISFDSIQSLSSLRLPLFASYNISFVKIAAHVLTNEMKRALKDPLHPKNVKTQLEKYGVQIIIEKVENEDQLQLMKDLNLNLAQGYIFGFPMPIRDISKNGFPQLEELKMRQAV